MKILLCALLLVVACHAHIEEETQTHGKTISDVEKEAQTDTHVVDAPDETTTTTEELDEGGRVRKRTVQVKKHGAVTIDKHANAKSQEREDSELDEKHKSKLDLDFLHSPLTWIGALVVVGALIVGIWKMRKAVPL